MTVKQRHENDCFLCCAAMAAGIDYDEALSVWPKAFSRHIARVGVKSDRDTNEVLKGLGLEIGVDYLVRDLRVAEVMQRPSMRVLSKYRAILQVPSLNHQDRFHMVYWDGEKLRDPSTAAVHSMSRVEAGWAWLFSR